MLSEPGLSYLGRYRTIGLLYVRDLGTDEAGVFDDADHVERLSDAGTDEVVVGTFGQEWVAIVRTGHAVLAEFARRPTVVEVLAARDLHLERLAWTDPQPGSTPER